MLRMCPGSIWLPSLVIISMVVSVSAQITPGNTPARRGELRITVLFQHFIFGTSQE